jgi:peptidoglycan/xylan/chitin deacetylase (PgdA/CDA1 family)
MALDHVVFDLDDFAEEPDRNCLDLLKKIKAKFPNLKVTLFSIPYYNNKDQTPFFHKVVAENRDWIQLGIHGWTHHSNFECQEWEFVTAYKLIKKAWEYGCFEKLFKAPGWQISRDTYTVLKNAGFICADHKESVYTEPGVPNKDRRPKHLRVYEIDHPWMVHGHTWNCVGNGLPELYEKWEKDGYPWDEHTQFHFITEMA